MASGNPPGRRLLRSVTSKSYRTGTAIGEDAPPPVILATSSVFPPNEHTQQDYCDRFVAT